MYQYIKGGSTTDINNYHPVSLLPISSKCFERVVFNRLHIFLEKYIILTDEQFGFRRSKTTTGAVKEQMKYIYENLYEGNIVISLFLSF